MSRDSASGCAWYGGWQRKTLIVSWVSSTSITLFQRGRYLQPNNLIVNRPDNKIIDEDVKFRIGWRFQMFSKQLWQNSVEKMFEAYCGHRSDKPGGVFGDEHEEIVS